MLMVVALVADVGAAGIHISTATAAEPKMPAPVTYVEWTTLAAGYNVSRARANKTVRALNKKRVMLKGYMVPLREDDSGVYEFLIVQYQAACEHVPPPPLNAFVHIKAPKGVPYIWGTMVVAGKLKVVEGKAIQREAPFQMTVDRDGVHGREEEMYDRTLRIDPHQQ